MRFFVPDTAMGQWTFGCAVGKLGGIGAAIESDKLGMPKKK